MRLFKIATVAAVAATLALGACSTGSQATSHKAHRGEFIAASSMGAKAVVPPADAAQPIAGEEILGMAALAQETNTPTPEAAPPVASRAVAAKAPVAKTFAAPVAEKTPTKAELKAMKKPAALKKPKAPKGDNWLVALLLCLFLGFLGIHRFYLGYTAIGLTQLAMFLSIFALAGLALVFAITSPLGFILLVLAGLIYLFLLVWVFIDLVRIIIRDLYPADGNYSF